MTQEFNRIWNRFLKFDWRFGLALLIIVCTIRFIIVLDANVTGSYSVVSYIMIFSALTPFIFLSKKGRRQIGMKKPDNYMWLLYSLFIGFIIASLLFLLGYLLYSTGYSNWYVYIGNSYNIPVGIAGKDKLIYFLIMAISGMIFSPIGEELFFRGIVHGSFSKSFGDKKASVIDSLAFAVTHLSHFGIVYISGVWKLLPVPALLWVAGMFVLSLFFFLCRKKSGSILGAVISHAGFNFGMIFWIFYGLN